jgi:ATP-dependent DNA helicase RecG
VATIAALVAAGNGYQTAFMVATEILANQHFEKLNKFLDVPGHKSEVRSHKKKINVALLTSSLDEKEKKEVLEKVKKGEIDILIGTHALIQAGVAFYKLGLIVIDEQHKFGVSQRSLLPQKGPNPDILIMTATPIPRTLSLTLFGDLDISVISELPQGRKKIQTRAYSFERRAEVFDLIRAEVVKGRQAFVVSPIIEENPKLELRSAKALFAEFSKEIFKDLRVGLLHGRMKQAEQEKVMHKFRDGDIVILVATTILEVGIDVPNATVMVIEHAERFGLSQLHQMRGRIGRGEHASHCFLISDPVTEDAQARLKVFVENADGFRIAEEDLKIRGPGEFFGERQHGLTELKIANPLTQMHLLKSAREEVVRLLKDDLKLEKRPNVEIKKELHKRFPEFEKFIEVG